ncbi:MAG: hypothetical protein CVV27_04995, partial [Candidatus Melainabacteria bacterium HGW-Melainabacteria-1]
PAVINAQLTPDRMAEIEHGFCSPGAVLIRHSGHSLLDFLGVSDHFGRDFVRVSKKGQVRQITGGNVNRQALPGYDSVFLPTGHGQLFALPLHGELYYQYRQPPELLWFFCQHSAAQDGETWLCDGADLFAALPAAIQQLLMDQQIVYTRCQPAANWQRDYGCEDFASLCAFLAGQGIEASLQPDGSLLTRYVCSALRLDQLDSGGQNRPVFINNLLPFALRELHEPAATQARVRFEDGSRIPVEMLQQIEAIAADLTCHLSWQAGDLLMLDNRRVMHGRGQISDPKRTLYLRMSHLARAVQSDPTAAELTGSGFRR